MMAEEVQALICEVQPGVATYVHKRQPEAGTLWVLVITNDSGFMLTQKSWAQVAEFCDGDPSVQAARELASEKAAVGCQVIVLVKCAHPLCQRFHAHLWVIRRRADAQAGKECN